MRIRGILHLPLVFMNVYEYKISYMYQIEYLDFEKYDNMKYFIPGGAKPSGLFT